MLKKVIDFLTVARICSFCRLNTGNFALQNLPQIQWKGSFCPAKVMVTKMKSKSLNVYGILSRIDFQIVAFLVLLFIAVQPLYGIFYVVMDNMDLTALFYAKSGVIRVAGYVGIIAAICNAYCKTVENGREYLKKKLLSNVWNGLFLAFMLWAVITTITSKNTYYAVYGYSYRFEGLVSYFGYAGIYLCGSMIRDEKKRNFVYDVAISASVLLAVVTLISESGTANIVLLERNSWVSAYSGTFINPNHYGYYLCVALMLCTGRMVDTKKLLAKACYLVAFALNMYVLCFNNSFGPVLALLIALPVFFIVYTVKGGIKKSWQYLLFMVIFVYMCANVNDQAVLISAKAALEDFKELTTALFGITWPEAVEVNQVASVGRSGLSLLPKIFSLDEVVEEMDISQADLGKLGSGRIEIWRAGLQLWKENPVFGVGIDNSTYQMSFIIYSYDVIHNEYIQIMAELGTPGILFYLSAHVSLFFRNLRRLKKLSGAAFTAVGAVAVYMISAFFGVSIPFTESFLFLCLGMCNGYHTDAMLNEMLPDNAAAYVPAK